MRKFNFRTISIITNLMSIGLYAISTLIWVMTDLASDFLKYFSLGTIVIYLIVFILITTMSSKKNYSKNLKRYKKLMKQMKVVLNIMNMIVIVISTISLFEVSLKNITTIIINLVLIGTNLLSLGFKFFIYVVKYRLNKKLPFKKKKTFFGFVFENESPQDEIIEDDTIVETEW